MLNIVLVFHDILKSYLISIYLLILAISGIIYGHLFTMATKARTCLKVYYLPTDTDRPSCNLIC